MVIIGLTPIEVGKQAGVGDVEALGPVDGAVGADDAGAGSAAIRAVPIG